MFQEKKQEVQTAILRVDQLSQQLEDLKKGKLNGLQPYTGKLPGPAAVELKRLYQELQVTVRDGCSDASQSPGFLPWAGDLSCWGHTDGC